MIQWRKSFIAVIAALIVALLLCSCVDNKSSSDSSDTIQKTEVVFENVQDLPAPSDNTAQLAPELVKAPDQDQITEPAPVEEPAPEPVATEHEPAPSPEPAPVVVGEASISYDMRSALDHGPKDAAHQKYIMLHDTEVNASPWSIISSWDGSGNFVAAHFVVGRDGTIVQCVPLDRIAHHAGYGNAGHNTAYGVSEDGRDDMRGTMPIGSWAPDYGMNAWSVGIEMVHCSGDGYYPEEQLAAVDSLIAYIDNYFGFPSAIIDHKAWRSGNSDTSPEFAGYLANYQAYRHH